MRAAVGVSLRHAVLIRVPGLVALATIGCNQAPRAPSGLAASLDGTYASDVPSALLPDGGAACINDYAPGARNPGRVTIAHGDTFSFYEDRSGERPVALGCRYVPRGTARDPRWFGSDPGQSTTSIWSLFELASEPGQPPACEPMFHFVAVRPPEGEGKLLHLHLRHAGVGESLASLVARSREPEGGPNPCDPWWSVYCLPGVTGCDPE